ncbi:MAG: hypothetical protein FGM32_07805 [Candidatus Kapabacteria bacterium]|nr:hypothetical protein [Candidatus Kapabacteria bacterium]
MNPDVTPLFERSKTWREEISALRELVLETDLTEELKWYQPCYTFAGKNVALIGKFKDCCVLSFLKGALLTDTNGILEAPGPNSQSARVVRIRSIDDVRRLAPSIRKLLKEAIANEKAGRTVAFKPIAERDVPEELEEQFAKVKGLRKAFEALTPGRRRAYLMHFSSAKQTSTRTSRIERAIPAIMEGKGMGE